jgi:transmembrane sensor
MGTKRAEELLQKYLDGKCTPEELAMLESWYTETSNTIEELPGEVDYKCAHHLLINKLPVQRSPVKLWPRILVATAAVAAVVFGVWFFYSSQYLVFSSQNLSGQSANDIAPGKNTATLTLANGKTINLSDAKTGVVIGDELKYNDGTEVARFSPSGGDGVAGGGSNNDNPLSLKGSLPEGENRMITASTPRGGTYQITLPDGSKVWLNAASSIIFPSTFGKLRMRKVELIGEAYFEVFKNKNQPFVVKSKKMELTVLGTHFNVNAYEDENSTKATLLEGSVRVSRFSPSGGDGRRPEGEDNENRILKPNQQALLTTSNQLQIKDVDVTEAVAWKNGLFSFNNAPMQTVMRQIARWYNVEVQYESEDLKNKLLDGSVSRYDKVSGILHAITQTGAAKFKIEDKKIIVIK